MSKGLLCHLLSVNDLEHDIPSIESVPVVNEFQDVFPEYLSGVPPIWEINFGIDIEPDTKQIPIPPYRMAKTELKEFKLQLEYLIDKVFIPKHIPLGSSNVVCEKERWNR